MSPQRDGRAIAYVQRTAIWLPAAIITLLMLPLVTTRRTFGPDWTLHLWAIRQQQWNIHSMAHPGLFISVTRLGAFYPLFAFVGSGIYAVGGYLAVLVGPIAAYKCLYLVALCLAYGGFTWLSVLLGLGGWRSQVPGAVLVTGAYFVTDFVGRGDFGELIAVASLPLLAAAICAMVTLPSVRLRHRLAVVVGVFVLTGSHNITLLWGTTFMILVGVVLALTWGREWRHRLPWPRLGHLVGLGVIGAGLNAWYLLPDLAYSLDTRVGRSVSNTQPFRLHIGTIWPLLNPLRPGDPARPAGAFSGRDIRLSFPCLFLAWALLVAIALWRGRDRAARTLFIGVAAVTSAFAVLVETRRPWRWIPHVYWSTQFTYRMDAYVLLGAALLVMITLVWLARAREGDPRRSWMHVMLAAVLVFSAGAATWQVWDAQSWFYPFSLSQVAAGDDLADQVVASRDTVSPSWYSSAEFVDVSIPVVGVAPGRSVHVPYAKIHGSSFSGSLAVPNGPAPFATNIAAGPRFVETTGITAIGRTNDGFMVARRADGAPVSGPVAVTIRPAQTLPLRAGAIGSMLSLVALLAVILWPLRRWLRRLRRGVAGGGA